MIVAILVGLAIGAALVLSVPPLSRVAGRGAGRAGAGGRGGLDAVVVIPARDEADVIGGLLDDLAAQLAPAARIVVVDDASTDSTADIVTAHPGVELRSAGPTPEGWNPKTWALHVGAHDAAEDALVLLDADVRLAAGALAAVLDVVERRGGLVTVAPRHDVGTATEALSLPFNLVSVMGAAGGRAAFGPCLVMRTAEHRALGGHEAVAEALVDDVAWARHCRRRGVDVCVTRGGELVRYRMYRHGLGDVAAGWTKNLALGARATAPARSALVVGFVTAALVPLVGAIDPSSPPVEDLVAWGVVGAVMWGLGRAVGRFPVWVAAVGPLLALWFVLIFGRSVWAVLSRRSVRWKGRDLSTTAGPTAGEATP